jgi:hypothetical protein
MINPFIICSVEQQNIYRQYANREAWIVACLLLGGDRARLDAFDQDATRYAATTVYPNSDVVAYCRTVVKQALQRGEPLPTTAQEAIENDDRWRLLQIAERFGWR